MAIKKYEDPCNWFQAGWNIAVVEPYLLSLPTTLEGWNLYDFVAGFAAAMHKQTLPSHWLE